MPFAATIIRWYRKHQRMLPWRETSNPYHIWLSEVILQQTRVEQGKAYYFKFLNNFPNIHALANAPQGKVLKLWQGLGYYSRARNLHITAKEIVKTYHGKFPNDPVELKKLKGIGDYTAAAIASIAFNKAVPAIDGNAIRVYARIFGVTGDTAKKETVNEIRNIAADNIPAGKASEFNQAIMEFGALQCIPGKPDCGRCIFSEECFAYRNNLVAKLPIKSNNTKVVNRYFNYLLITSGSKSNPAVYIHKRGKGDIWEGLYDFPMIETTDAIPPEKLCTSKEWKALFGKRKLIIRSVSEEIKHQLTHQKIFARFFWVSIETEKDIFILRSKKVKLRKLHEYAVPRLIEIYIDKYLVKSMNVK